MEERPETPDPNSMNPISSTVSGGVRLQSPIADPSPAPETHPTGPDPSPRTVSILLALILLGGFLLRLANLDVMTLWIDEDLTWLAVKGIHEQGLPRMPSGELYTRGPLYNYLVALIAGVGGSSPMALRALSLVMSVILMWVVFRFGRSLGGSVVGLTAALILAANPWDVHYAVMARNYELFLVLFTLSVYLGYRGLLRRDVGARRWLLLTSALAVMVHILGAMLVSVFAAPLVFSERYRPPLRWMIPPVVAVVVAFALVTKLSGLWSGPDLELVPHGGDRGVVAVPIIGEVDLNHARIMLLEIGRRSGVLAVVVALPILGIGGFLVARLLRDRRPGAAAAMVAFTACLLANQLVPAALAAAVLVKLMARSPGEAVLRLVQLGVVCAVAAVLLLGGVVVSGDMDALRDRTLIRSFAAIPVPWYRLLLLKYPLMVGALAIAGGLAYLRSFRPQDDQRALYLLTSIVGPLVLMGIMSAPYFAHRYNLYLNPLLVVAFAMVLVAAVRAVAQAMAGGRKGWVAGVMMAAVGLLMFCEAFDPAQVLAMRQRTFGYNRDFIRDPDVTASFHYDFTTTTDRVAASRGPDDLLITRDPTNVYPHLGPSTHVISAFYEGASRTSSGELVDYYLGIPYLPDSSALGQVLRDHADRRCWIIYTLNRSQGPVAFLTPDQEALLDDLDGYRVHTGEDGLTVVLEIPPRSIPSPTSEADPR